MKKLRIRRHELGLWFRHGDFVGVLDPGAYLMPGRFTGRDRVEVVNTLAGRFVHANLDVLVQDEDLARRLTIVDLTDTQRAFVWKDDRLDTVLGPGRYAFWKTPFEFDVEVHDVAQPLFDHPRREAILAHPESIRFLEVVQLAPYSLALLYHRGKLIDRVESGVAVYWKLVDSVHCMILDVREKVVEVSGQEIMTADRVTLRLTLVVTYQVRDPETATTVVGSFEQALYREAQLALRAAVSDRALDALLGDKEAVGREVQEAITPRAQELGLELKSLGLRDVILPGDMKTILNRVIEAQKEAEANLIRRREETAAARSQANTARLVAENPVLARMKELEAVQAILSGTKATFVFGQGDLVRELRELTAPAEETGDR